MQMLNKVQIWFSWLMNIGVREEYSTVKSNRIQIANAFFVIAAPLIIANTISNIAEQDSVGFTIDVVLAIIIIAIPIFNNYGWHQLVYGYTVFLATIITDGLFVLFGSMVSISPIYMLGILMTVFCYDKLWIRVILVIFVFANYFYMQEFYLPNNTALIQKIGETDYADHLYFIFSIIAVSGITIRVLNQNKEVIRENEKQLAATQRLNQQLEDRNNDLEQFTYISSHDLKEPLRSITSFSSLLQKRLSNQNDGTAQEYLKYIKENATHMNELVNSIANYMNIAASNDKKQRVDLNPIIHNAINNISFQIQSKNAIIEYATLPKMSVNKQQVQLLFQHLIENAIKYNNHERPKVIIVNENLENHIQFSIQDNGIGISSEYAEQIFTPFKKLHHKTKYYGSGIGLAICKKIVGQHNGRIWVQSELGKGSTFYFTLPKESISQSES